MTTHMSLKTMPDDNLVLSVGFWVQTIVIHCPDTCFYSLAILTVLFWGWFVWGLFEFWRGSLVGWRGWFLLVLWWVDLVWVFWFWFFCCFGFGFLLGPVHPPPPEKKKRGGGQRDNNGFIHLQLWGWVNTRTRLGASQSWAWMLRATHPSGNQTYIISGLAV